MIEFLYNIPMEVRVIILAGLIIGFLEYIKTKLKNLVKDKNAKKGRR